MIIERGGRLVIGATCFADARAAIDLAVVIAKTLEMDIVAFLLEDEAVYLASNHPSARTITHSGSSLPVTGAIMREAFEKDARALEHALSAMEKRSGLRWSFNRLAGNLESLLERENGNRRFSLFGADWVRLQSPDPKNAIVAIVEDASTQSITSSLAKMLASELTMSFEAFQTNDETIEGDGLISFLQNRSLSAAVVSNNIVQKYGIENILNAARCPVIVPDETYEIIDGV